MSRLLFIPKKINVGFQERSSTYTGKLAYVIYYDNKGKLRKEKSWSAWRTETIPNQEFDNTPTEGFVLNKKVGGHSSGWNHRNSYIRVYDPRGFEFEITVENLLFILANVDCSRGKGLEGKFVYSWSGTDLVLLPACTEDFKTSEGFTKIQGQRVYVKDLVEGYTYLTKNTQKCIYLGKLQRYQIIVENVSYEDDTYLSGKNIKNKDKPVHAFKKYNTDGTSEFYFPKSMSEIAVCSENSVSSEYTSLIEEYSLSAYGSKVVDLELKYIENPKNKRFAFKEDGQFTVYDISAQGCRWGGYGVEDVTWENHTGKNLALDVRLKGGYLTMNSLDRCYGDSTQLVEKLNDRSNTSSYGYRVSEKIAGMPWNLYPQKSLVATLESGSQYIVDYYTLTKKVN